MPHGNPPPEQIRDLLAGAKTIAIVGASSNPARPSHGIMRKLQSVGYRVVPVNPNEKVILGEHAYPSLEAVPGPIDIVDVFRRPEYTVPIAEAAVRVGAKALWLQQGISNEQAAAVARAGGLTVIMDECIGVMHSVLRVPPKQR